MQCIHDGFWFRAGTILAEIAAPFVIVGAAAAVVVAIIACSYAREKLRGRRGGVQ
ncbi:hypothetical protein IST4116A_01225 [Burkholderia cenocepacia]|uniref:hypothetical protein n=1 Tax=Burkholderia cenocepacia TaxID=95486 RepID=UPI0019A589F4|nr:hypothetical protein [Burkholderia cenocepacia]MCW3657563.1 hypothetical protein [Burkholderia cenocepacia]CAB5083230.1 hypothetical protein IST4116B_01217 [Burkholderia cenocepacia]CAB5083910.1 hypothetical protein IST4134_01226 [Burkholderia cenocepacia]CAB5087969.1 hypothetical protein IST4113_01224 [Burkholderia cenocepacia]CAB5096013.1 hypothetical protein IST439_01264 [Burkholderia cenocepacia]